MQQILFRGKRIKDGQWVYGYYVKATMHWHKYGIHEDFIVCNAIQNGGYFTVTRRYAVDPKTIGQFTGYKDKNGDEIFAGDIIYYKEPFTIDHMIYHRQPKEEKFIICFENGAFSFKYFDDDEPIPIEDDERGIFLDLYQYEIIGNIYDKCDKDYSGRNELREALWECRTGVNNEMQKK